MGHNDGAVCSPQGALGVCIMCSGEHHAYLPEMGSWWSWYAFIPGSRGEMANVLERRYGLHEAPQWDHMCLTVSLGSVHHVRESTMRILHAVGYLVRRHLGRSIGYDMVAFWSSAAASTISINVNVFFPN